MRRTRCVSLVLVVICLALAGCGGAPAPQADEKSSYAPYLYMVLKLNCAWVHGVKLFGSGGQAKSTYDQTTTITQQVQVDGKPWYLATISGMGHTEMLYRKVPTAVHSRPNCNGSVTHCLLKGPLVAGTSWRVEGGWAAIKQVGLTVTVPAGTFNGCVLVVETLPTYGATWRYKRWFAPNVGEIKSEVWSDGTICQRNLLKSFTGG